MKKKLLVCMMALVLGLTGCSGSSGSSDNSSAGENTVKETEKEGTTKNYYGNKYREQYDVGLNTYISQTSKFLIENNLEYVGNYFSGVWGITDVGSNALIKSIHKDNAEAFEVDLKKNYADEEMLEITKPVLKLDWNKIYTARTNYARSQIDIQFNDVTTVKVDDYEFIKGTGIIMVPPTTSNKEEALEPISMDVVTYVKRMDDGNIFVFYQFADTNYQKSGEEPVSIKEMEECGEDILKTYREYDCEYSDFNEGV